MPGLPLYSRTASLRPMKPDPAWFPPPLSKEAIVPNPCPSHSKLGGIALPLAIFGLLAISTHAHSEEGDDGIVTDRPDFVESSLTVGKGRFQIETSVGMETDKSDGTKTRTLTTPTLFRYGVSENWELRLETDGAIHQRTTDQANGETLQANGAADVELGLKWHVLDSREGTVVPSVALLFHYGLNSGSTAFRSPSNVPSIRATMEWELPHEMGLGIMTGLARQEDADASRYTEGILGIVLGKNWTPTFRTFVEVAGSSLKSKTYGGSQITWDTGMNWAFTKYSQLDAAVFLGANGYTPDLAFTIGYSTKF
jgi:hypothetical protein